MKKGIFSVAVASLFTMGAMAQVKPTTNPGNFIVKGGLNLANISITNEGKVDNANAYSSFNVGFAFDVPLSEYASFQSGLLYTGKGSKREYGKPGQIGYTKLSTNPMYLELPVNIVGKLPLTNTIKVFLGGGAYGAMGITGKNKFERNLAAGSIYSDNNIKFSNDDPTTSQEEGQSFNSYKRFDYGLNALGGLEFSRFTLGANYGLGLAKINSGTDNTANDRGKNRVWSFSLGIKL
ncbi:MAG TPA: porin family protein [Segetibacter sp.]